MHPETTTSAANHRQASEPEGGWGGGRHLARSAGPRMAPELYLMPLQFSRCVMCNPPAPARPPLHLCLPVCAGTGALVIAACCCSEPTHDVSDDIFLTLSSFLDVFVRSFVFKASKMRGKRPRPPANRPPSSSSLGLEIELLGSVSSTFYTQCQPQNPTP